MRTALTFVAVLASMAVAQAQVTETAAATSEITIYSERSLLADLSPLSRGSAFYGYIFDGDHSLAYIKYRTYVTLHLPPGTHVFSATIKANRPDKSSLLTIETEPGGHYFLRASENQESLIVIPISFIKGILEEVPCETAHKEAASARPIPTKRIAPDLRSSVNPATSFPTCQ